MNELVLAFILAIICPIIISFFVQFGRFAYRSILFPGLAINVVAWGVKSGEAEVTLKLAYSGNSSLIIEALSIKARFSPDRWRNGFLLWPRTIIGFMTGDKYLSGRAFANRSTSPLSGQKEKAGGLSVCQRAGGIIIGLFLCIPFVIWTFYPLFWPILGLGPLGDFQMVANTEAIRVKRISKKVLPNPFLLDELNEPPLQPPFLIDANSEDELQIRYKLALSGRTNFDRRTRFGYISAVPQKRHMLPEMNEFVWQGKEILLLKINGKWKQYPLEITTSFVNIQ